MQADGVMRPALFEYRKGSTTPGEEILGMDFKKVDVRLYLNQLAVVRVPPADSDCRGLRVFHVRRMQSAARPGGESALFHAFGFVHGHAFHGLAGAFGNVFPLILVVTHLGLPGTGMGA